ncbi:MAG: hypothetical protein ACOZCL_09245 [Bacillota bacterium]
MDVEKILPYFNQIDNNVVSKRISGIMFLFTFFGVILAISDPFNLLACIIIMTGVGIINLLGMILLRSKKRIEVNFYLYLGIFYLLSSISFLTLFYKFIYAQLNINNIVLVILAGLLYLIIICIEIIITNQRVKNGYYTDNKYYKSMTKKWIGPLSLIGLNFIGMYTARAYFHFLGVENEYLGLAFLFLGLCYLFEIGIVNMIKYIIVSKEVSK